MFMYAICYHGLKLSRRILRETIERCTDETSISHTEVRCVNKGLKIYLYASSASPRYSDKRVGKEWSDFCSLVRDNSMKLILHMNKMLKIINNLNEL